jgi:hypothetical protein
MIEHVLACLAGREKNQIDPTSVLNALQLTLDVHRQLTTPPTT